MFGIGSSNREDLNIGLNGAASEEGEGARHHLRKAPCGSFRHMVPDPMFDVLEDVRHYRKKL
jgi:hypothetical protein